MTLLTQINLLVTSLPKSVQDKLDKKSLNKIEDLMSKLKWIGQANVKEGKTQSSKPCPFCEAQGFAGRFHEESVCKLEKNKDNKMKNEKIRVVNHAQAQDIIASLNITKNE